MNTTTALPASDLRYADGSAVHRGDTIVAPLEGDILSGRLLALRGGKTELVVLIRPNGDERVREIPAAALGIHRAAAQVSA